MASTKKQKPIGGPFLASAVFCDFVMRGDDGTMSAIRIVDKINVMVPAEAPPDVPSEEKRIPVAIWTLLIFKTGSAKGKHVVSLVVQSPSGKRQDGPKHEVKMGPEPQGGANLRIHLGLAIKAGGLFVVDVLLDGKVVTRMPLLISVAREESPKAATPAVLNEKPSKPAKNKRSRS